MTQDQPAPAGVPDRRSPYRGLLPYTEDDSQFFFGRERDTAVISANLTASRLTLLYGPSGSGKTSVLRAGVVRHLIDSAVQNRREFGAPELAVVYFGRWQDDPVATLSRRIDAAVAEALDEPSTGGTASNGSFEKTLEEATARLRGDLLIMLDQFEEYFLYHDGEDGDGTFAAELPRALNRPDLPVNFLIGIREDALARLDAFKGRVPALFTNRLRLDKLRPDQARVAIDRPVTKFFDLYGDRGQPKRVQPELIDAVLSTVRTGQILVGEIGRGGVGGEQVEAAPDAPIETPFLQIVMERVWDAEVELESDELRLDTLEERLGGSERIIQTHLDGTMAEFSPEQRDIAARMFYHLVTPGGAKIAQEATDLAGYAGQSVEAVLPLLEKLSSSETRILTKVPPPNRPDVARYEISHDVLSWAILNWRARHEQDAARREGEARERERRLAQEESERRRRWVKSVASFMVAAIIIVVSGLLWYSIQYDRVRDEADRERAVSATLASEARDQATAAAVAQDEADARATVAVIAQEQAEAQATRAAEAQQLAVAARATGDTFATAIAESRGGVATAQAQIEAQQGQVGQAKLDEGRVKAPVATPALSFLYARGVLTGHVGSVNDAEFDRTGDVVGTVGNDGSLRLWDSTTGASLGVWGGPDEPRPDAPRRDVSFNPVLPIVAGAGDDVLVVRLPDRTPQRLPGVTGRLNDIAFSPDGSYLAAGAEDGRIWLWRMGAGPGSEIKSPENIASHTSPATSVDMIMGALDSPLVLTTSQGGSARIWERGGATGWKERIGVPSMRGAGLHNGDFSPDGRLVVLAASNGETRVWEVDLSGASDPGIPVVLQDGHSQAVRRAVFSPDGRTILTVSADTTARLWDVLTLQKPRVLTGHQGVVRYGAFSPDTRWVVTASSDATARVWSTADGSEVATLRGHTGPLTTAAFSPDSRYVVTASEDGTARIWDPWQPEPGP